MSEKLSKRFGVFRSSHDDAKTAQEQMECRQCQSPTYRLAFQDTDFLLREELRPVRLQLELLKPELVLQEQKIESTVVVYGSARMLDPETAAAALKDAESAVAQYPEDSSRQKALAKAKRAVLNSRYYQEARTLGRLISENTKPCKHVVMTGGGFGIMGAANQGAHDVGAQSIGMNIVLPFEQEPNPYITPELSFQFHYFAIRKMHLLMRAKAVVAFPGGFGTMDELFEALTLIQTHKVAPIPVLLFGRDFWQRAVNFETFVEEGTISQGDLDLFRYVDTAEEAWNIIAASSYSTTDGKV